MKCPTTRFCSFAQGRNSLNTLTKMRKNNFRQHLPNKQCFVVISTITMHIIIVYEIKILSRLVFSLKAEIIQ